MKDHKHCLSSYVIMGVRFENVCNVFLLTIYIQYVSTFSTYFLRLYIHLSKTKTNFYIYLKKHVQLQIQLAQLSLPSAPFPHCSLPRERLVAPFPSIVEAPFVQQCQQGIENGGISLLIGG